MIASKSTEECKCGIARQDCEYHRKPAVKSIVDSPFYREVRMLCGCCSHMSWHGPTLRIISQEWCYEHNPALQVLPKGGLTK
jgi:hypothetical protein